MVIENLKSEIEDLNATINYYENDIKEKEKYNEELTSKIENSGSENENTEKLNSELKNRIEELEL